MAKFRVAAQDPPDARARRHMARAWAIFLAAVMVVIGLTALWAH